MNFPSTSTEAIVETQPQKEADTHLRGHWLVLARIGWIVIAGLTLGLYVASIPNYFAYLHVVCTGNVATCRNSGQLTPGDLRALQALGLSLDFYARYEVALYIGFTVGFAVIGALIFWRKSDDRMALFASLTLIMFPAGFNTMSWLHFLRPGCSQSISWPSWAISLSSSSSTCFLPDDLSRVGHAGSGWE